MITVNYRSPLPLYQQIKESVTKLIITGAVRAGEQLPSVRELATQLAINPNTIARAYRELESEGYIYTVSGRGCFVAERADSRANTDAALEAFRESAAKLIFGGIDSELLKAEIDKINGEVAHNA